MKLSVLTSLFLTSIILMGCQIEVTPLDNPQGETENSQTTSDSRPSGDSDTGTQPPATPAVSLNIAWEIPVERENNEQLYLYEIGGYEIEYRRVGETDYSTVLIEDGAIEEFLLTNISAGTYEVRIAAFDTNGLYSRFSDPAILEAS